MAILEPTTSTVMTRTTVHRQYNGKAFGFYMLNNMVPIVLNIRKPGKVHYRAVLVYGRKTRNKSPYSDLGLMTKECQRVFLFNVRHYVKCYLPAQMGSDGNPTQPYTYNLCQYCGASVKDDNNRLLQQIATLSYRVDSYLWKAKGVLQSPTGPGQLFTAPSGVR